ncbi:MAG: hypothetical protein CMJ67_03830 [Planctomycetaceae bacterium]|nr:hypothetical protein [Planctomycetaceae bacterium]
MVVCLLIISILPVRWLSSWSGRIGELASLPLVPLGDGFTAIRVWLEPGGTREDPRTAEVWRTEAGIYKKDLQAAEAEIRRLTKINKALGGFSVETAAEASQPLLVSAKVVGIDPSPGGEQLVTINKGRSFGIRPGGVALHDQDVLVGYVLGPIGRATATIRPMHSRETRPIRAVIPIPSEEPASTTPSEPLPLSPDGTGSTATADKKYVVQKAWELLLSPDGSGWTATVPKEYAAQKGWEVRLADEDWPRWAQGCVLGRVENVQTSDSNPNWNDLRIQPSNPIHGLRRILVVSEGDAEPETSSTTTEESSP